MGWATGTGADGARVGKAASLARRSAAMERWHSNAETMASRVARPAARTAPVSEAEWAPGGELEGSDEVSLGWGWGGGLGG